MCQCDGEDASDSDVTAVNNLPDVHDAMMCRLESCTHLAAPCQCDYLRLFVHRDGEI